MPVILLLGPAVAVIGLVAVVFVMRHKSVEKRSMYSARRSQIEHKVRAARQRTMAPVNKHAEKARAGEGASPAAPTLTYEPSAYAGPPVAPPPKKAPHMPWDSGPTAPAPSQPTFTPPAPPSEQPKPSPPAAEPPSYQPPAAEPPSYQPPAAEPVWTPTPAQQERATPAPAPPAMTSADAGAAWSVVGETKGVPEPEPSDKKKKSKANAQAGAWSLASGEAAGEETDDAPKRPSAVLAVAQYAVLVVGLVMVLIGVVVMVANSHVT
ncbi:MAG: hypothetical protein M3003_14660 [Candidatus Dormibacteraeota bacterium]|nr:hypothetical protein [Candidatus Dormibacteraeota bacterium]